MMADNQYQLEGDAPQLFERYAQTLGSPLAEQVFNHVELYPGQRVLDAARVYCDPIQIQQVTINVVVTLSMQ